MKFGSLADYFSAFAWKQVTAVEVDPKVSNEHEFNSSKRLREILGTVERRSKMGTGFPTQFFYFSDEHEEPIESSGSLSWYDSRANHPKRTEWRLYYTDNSVFGRNGCAQSGDSLIIAFTKDFEGAVVFVAAQGSTAERQIEWLFGIENPDDLFSAQSVSASTVVDSTRARILEAAGIVLPAKDDGLLKHILQKFKNDFPRSDEFSQFVRDSYPEVTVSDGPDNLLLHWMEHEEFAFRVLERHLVAKRLETGFTDVDDFVSFSLSVQNRRKSRAGRAFENHLGELFYSYDVAFERGAMVENRAKPDFLFPGVNQYQDRTFPLAWLTLLGAKTSCKDRWRQILSEGKRFSDRFLVTLEPAISSNQLAEMRESKVQLVVPAPLHLTYAQNDRSGVDSVADFISMVLLRQKESGVKASPASRKTKKSKR